MHEIDAALKLVDSKLTEIPQDSSAARFVLLAMSGHLLFNRRAWEQARIALESAITHPLFFEVHRLSEFSPRSLDVDVVLDLMIHDIDIVLSLIGSQPTEIRAAGTVRREGCPGP